MGKAITKNGFLWLLLFFIMGAHGSGWCADPPENKGAITVTDFRGKILHLPGPAGRIVCLIESALSGLYMLGAEDKVVGVSQNIYREKIFSYYAALDPRIRDRKLPAPGNWDFVNLESVVALRPDLVILWSHQAEAIAALEERGIPVLGIFINRQTDVYREIEALGLVTGKTPRARALIDYVQKESARFQTRIRAISMEKRPSVYYMWAQSNLDTSCGGSTVDDLIEQAGGRNVCASLHQEHVTVNLEKVLSWNPEMILMWYNEKKEPADVLRDDQWKRIKAVQTGRVYEFPEVFLCDLWTLKFLYAVKLTAKWAHPALFRDIDPDKEKKAMLQFFYGPRLAGR
jgi:iron complex transport system substrate-binding protein